jgi:excinuclease ABC subunit B
MARDDQEAMLANLEDQMRAAAKRLDFEDAANLRDTVMELKLQIGK